MNTQPIAIVGGGIGGLTTAIALQRKGLAVKVYESAPEIKPLGAGLALAGNAVKALHDIGIAEAVIARGQKMKNLYVKDERGEVISYTNAEEMSMKFGRRLRDSLIRLVPQSTIEKLLRTLLEVSFEC